MDLSTTALHTTSFLIAKLLPCGLRFDTVTFLCNYLKDRKQSVKIKAHVRSFLVFHRDSY